MRTVAFAFALLLAVCVAAGAAGGGRKHRPRHRPVAAAAGAAPLQAMKKHVCGLHRAAADSHEQMIAHHYCSKQPDGLTQCALFDSNTPNARLIGVEYIISAERFKMLPESERKLWHSHVFEVQSGQLTPLPLAGGRNADVPLKEQRAALTELMQSFGKTIHTWNFAALKPTADAELAVPIGPPQLMVSFTGPDQANAELLTELDRRAGNTLSERSAWRRTGPNAIKLPAVMVNGTDSPEFSGVDAWQTGVTPVFAIAHLPTDTRQLPAERDVMKRKEAVPLDMGKGIPSSAQRPGRDGPAEVEVELKPAERISAIVTPPSLRR